MARNNEAFSVKRESRGIYFSDRYFTQRMELAPSGLSEEFALILAIDTFIFTPDFIPFNYSVILEFVQGQVVGHDDDNQFAALVVLEGGGSRLAILGNLELGDDADHLDFVRVGDAAEGKQAHRQDRDHYQYRNHSFHCASPFTLVLLR